MFQITVPAGHLSSAGERRFFSTQYEAISWCEQNCIDAMIQDKSGKDMCSVEWCYPEPTKLLVLDVRFLDELQTNSPVHIKLDNIRRLRKCLDEPTVEVSGINMAV